MNRRSLLAAVLLLPTLALAEEAKAPPPPTPEQIYSASKTDFAAMIRSQDLKMEFREQSDGTFLGVVKPTYEQQNKIKFLAKEQFSNLLGSWADVSRRIGSVRNTDGKLVSLEAGLEIKEANRMTYLVVMGVDSQSKPGQHVCVQTITGVGEASSSRSEKPELTPRRFGALVGCGLIKNVLFAFDEDRVLKAQTMDEALDISAEPSKKIAEALGHKVTTFKSEEFKEEPKEPEAKSPGGGE